MGEDNRVLLPVMVHLDGFALTHMIEPIMFPEERKVAEFLPPYNPPVSLNPAKPVTMGALGPPNIYTEAKYAQDVRLRESKKVILEVWKEFGRTFGRSYNPVEKHHSDGAKTLLMTMGSFSETAMVAVDKMRDEGKDVGLIKLRLWRPFPFEELREAVRDAEVLIVLDRAISFGGPGGPVFSEICAALYGLDKKPRVVGFVGGLGGRDISTGGFEEMVDKGIEIARSGSVKEYELFGVRE
jgi:pyruvate ferredoxin oxidoreductase alpha subunit